MTETLKFKRVSIFRRICSMLFDVILLLSFFVLIEAFIVEPVFSSTTQYDELYAEYSEKLEATHLYKYYSENDAVSMISSDYDNALTAFYEDGCLGYTIDDYNEWKSSQYYNETPLFVLNEDGTYSENIYYQGENGMLIDSTLNTEVQQRYYSLVKKLANEVLEQDDIASLSSRLSAFIVLFYVLAFIPSVLLTYLMFPLIFKDGTTLGKKIMQMQVIDSRTGKYASRFQLFIRFVFFSVIAVLLGVYSYGVVTILSALVMVFTPKRQTIHDLIASTIVVCNPYSAQQRKEKDDIIITINDGNEENDNPEENLTDYMINGK